MVILLLCNHTNHIASFPGSPHTWAKKTKGRGEPGKIFHVRNVTGRENLITCGWTNELVHVLLTDYTLLLVQLWKLYGQQNKTRQHYATSESPSKRLAYTNTDSIQHLKITQTLIVAYLTTWSLCSPVSGSYLTTWSLCSLVSGLSKAFKHQGGPFLGFAQAFSVLIVWNGLLLNTATCTVDYATTCVGNHPPTLN